MTPDPVPPDLRRPAGTGSQRERRPGVWEIRVPVGRDPATRRTLYGSVTVYGDRAQADAHRQQLLTTGVPPGRLTVADLLIRWLEADQPWKPSTLIGYRSVVRGLLADPLSRTPVGRLMPHDVRQALGRWSDAGAGLAVVGGRFRVLRAALGWAYGEHLIDQHPLRGMRGPGKPAPRKALADDLVRALLATAETRLLEAVANDSGSKSSAARRHRAEQDLLLVRLAADTGARRGELAALQIADLSGRTLCIERALSAGELTTPKSGHGRGMTVGTGTALLWHQLAADWAGRSPAELGSWLFSTDPTHHRHVGAEVLGHRFLTLRTAAGIPEATLHRLRHSVATFLVARGQILQAQARLGHADAATTLREYAHALPLTDGAVADAIDRHLDPPAVRSADVRHGG